MTRDQAIKEKYNSLDSEIIFANNKKLRVKPVQYILEDEQWKKDYDDAMEYLDRFLYYNKIMDIFNG